VLGKGTQIARQQEHSVTLDEHSEYYEQQVLVDALRIPNISTANEQAVLANTNRQH